MKADDRTAFVEFASARSVALHRYAYLLVGDRQLAEDLLQESLTKTLTRTAISWWRRKGWTAEKPRDDVPEVAGGG